MPDPEDLTDRASSPPRYAFSVSDPYRFIYVRTAKVATQSISKALRSHPELQVKRVGKLRPYPRGPRREYFSFAFVRNPYARIASTWRDKVVGLGMWSLPHVRDLDFDDFVGVLETLDLCSADRHIRPQHRLIPTERISFLGRLESLSTDWQELCAELALGEITLAHTHKSAAHAEDRSVHIDHELADRIFKLYALDFRLFGYSRDVPGPLR